MSKYPDLAAELLRRQWTEAEVKGALANNLLRVFEAVEQVRGPTLPASPTISCPQAGGRPVSFPRRAVTRSLPARSPSHWTNWRPPAGPATATQGPPASTSSRGPCWPPSRSLSSACVPSDALAAGTAATPCALRLACPGQAPALPWAAQNTGTAGPSIKLPILRVSCHQHPGPGGGSWLDTRHKSA